AVFLRLPVGLHAVVRFASRVAGLWLRLIPEPAYQHGQQHAKPLSQGLHRLVEKQLPNQFIEIPVVPFNRPAKAEKGEVEGLSGEFCGITPESGVAIVIESLSDVDVSEHF